MTWLNFHSSKIYLQIKSELLNEISKFILNRKHKSSFVFFFFFIFDDDFEEFSDEKSVADNIQKWILRFNEDSSLLNLKLNSDFKIKSESEIKSESQSQNLIQDDIVMQENNSNSDIENDSFKILNHIRDRHDMNLFSLTLIL